jgi:hypothetical protein
MVRWVVVALIACNGDKDGVGKGEVGEVVYTAGAITGTGSVSYTTDVEGQAHVEHSLDDGDTWISSAAVDAGSGSIPVIGMRVASTIQLKVVVEADGERVESEPIEVETDPPPTGTAPFALSRWVPEESCMDGGHVMFSTLSQGDRSGMGIVDRDGKFVWALGNDTPDTLIGRVRPSRDGKSILWNVAHDARIDDLAHVFRMDLDGGNRVETRTLNGHHDFVELPDESTIAWLGYEFRDLALPELGTSDPDPVAADVVFEGPEGLTTAEEAVDVFNMFDDWYGITVSGPDMEKCPTVPGAPNGFLPGYCEFSHGNSLAYLPEDDAYLVMLRWLDALVKVDRASGEIVWVFGGEHDMFTGNDADRFIHGHFSDAWKEPDGLHVLIVDNNDPPPGLTPADVGYSRYTEFVLDQTAMTFERTWVYQSDKFENLLGDIRRIPIEGCDNLLISFSAQGRIVEMTRANEIVWDIGLPLGNVTSRVHFLPDLYDLSGVAYP